MATMLPPAVMNGSAARARATSEYALISIAVLKAAREVLTKSPSRASFGAKATEWSSRSRRSV